MTKNITKTDRILGCMVGGAAGDALGYAVEFMTYDSIVARYGKPGITRYELNGEGVAEISDDTQMSLFVANGLMLGDTYVTDKGIGSAHGYDWPALQAWYLTQTSSFDTPRDKYWHIFWLLDEPRLYARRAPGHTCMSALSGQSKNNNSKGCGGIMRIAPEALYEYDINRNLLWEHTQKMVEYTHHHPLGYIPAILLVDTLSLIMQASGPVDLEATVHASIAAMRPLLDNEPGKSFVSLVEKAFRLAHGTQPDQAAIAELGEGWTADETLPIALFCAARHPHSFEDAIIAAVNHSGDSDSTGAVTGNIMGTLLGRNAIPPHFTRELELIDVIEEMARDVASRAQICFHAPATAAQTRWSEKYVRPKI